MLLLTAPKIAGYLPPTASRIGRIFSFGGGVQSTAVLVLQAQGKLPRPYDAFVFSNVGEDSENPDTLKYIEQWAKPFAERHGIKFVEVQKTRKGGKVETLYQYMHRTQRSIPIPARMGGNGAPGRRACTSDFKIAVVDRWAKAQGYTHVIIGLGISVDEFHRARDTQWHDNESGNQYGFEKKREYPLLGQHLRREQCRQVIEQAGLPIPPKSSCWFCPFRKRGEWAELKRLKPDLFQKAVALEKMLNEKRNLIGRDMVFLHPSLVPLDQAVGDQMPMFPEWEMDNCESGFCFV